jgi:hypothetical protein
MFRVGHRARPRDVDVQWNCRWMQATGSHDGYRVLPGKPTHTRTVQVEEYGLVRIDDEIDGEGRHDVRGSLLLDPAWRVVARDGDGWRVACDGRAVRIAVSSEQGVRLTDEPAAYHPRFGERLETTRLTWSVQGDLPARVQTSMEAVAVEAGGTA